MQADEKRTMTAGEIAAQSLKRFGGGKAIIRVFEAFAGYGSQAMALRRIEERFPEIEMLPVGISEIEPNAVMAYRAVHGDVPNFGDITQIDWYKVPDFDLFTWSFPCTDISAAGQQKGLSEGSGTRSSLCYEALKAISIKKPKMALMENVKALVGKKFLPEFQKLIGILQEMGYTNYWQVLNAKDYGVPQNRERVFMISMLGRDSPAYVFPSKQELELRLIDVLEDEVDESYYISDEKVAKVLEKIDPAKLKEIADAVFERYGKVHRQRWQGLLRKANC